MNLAYTRQDQDGLFLNISSYKFIQLNNLNELRIKLRNQLLGLGLKGTILIGAEGINMFLSGKREAIHSIWKFIKEQTPIGELKFKESYSENQPFRRSLVRIKKEIVTMGVPGIKPEANPAPRISAEDFEKWLDAKKEGKKDFIVLDTRNTYETRLGKFDDSIELKIENFREFPEALKAIDNLKDKTIVTLCTGGIRCEKAAPLMIGEGFSDVYQLEGGILKYFEEKGSKHFSGECFVFDQRVAVNGKLEETKTEQCFACRNPLSVEEQKSQKYVIEKYCPYCFDKNALKSKNENHNTQEVS